MPLLTLFWDELSELWNPTSGFQRLTVGMSGRTAALIPSVPRDGAPGGRLAPKASSSRQAGLEPEAPPSAPMPPR